MENSPPRIVMKRKYSSFSKGCIIGLHFNARGSFSLAFLNLNTCPVLYSETQKYMNYYSSGHLEITLELINFTE
jgi:hypothetical protein